MTRQWNGLLLAAALAALSVALSAAPASAGRLPNSADGHLLEKITLAGPNLTVQGSMAPELLPLVKVAPKGDRTVTDIVVPNALVNNLSLPESRQFSQNELLESVTVTEDVPNFRTVLTLKGRRPVGVKLELEQSNSKRLVFFLSENPGDPMGGARIVTDEEAMEGGSAAMISVMDHAEKIEQLATPVELAARDERMVGDDKVLLHPVAAMMVFQRPTLLQVSILNASSRQESAQKLAILIDRHQRARLEKRLGMKMDITNISSVMERTRLSTTKIYFRPNYLTAATALAENIPGEQVVEPMTMERLGRLGVDVEIFVGDNFE